MGLLDHPRPVSGEIMARPRTATQGARRAAREDALDAEFVVLDAKMRADRSHPFAVFQAATAGIGVLREEEWQASSRSRRGGPAFWLFGLLTAGGAFWISGGHAMFHMASLPSLPERERLRIEDLRSRVETVKGRPVLFVEGRIANRGAAEQALPPLSVAVTSRSGSLAHHNLGTSGPELAPGESFVFSGRFAAPMEGAESVSVSFGEN